MCASEVCVVALFVDATRECSRSAAGHVWACRFVEDVLAFSFFWNKRGRMKKKFFWG